MFALKSISVESFHPNPPFRHNHAALLYLEQFPSGSAGLILETASGQPEDLLEKMDWTEKKHEEWFEWTALGLSSSGCNVKDQMWPEIFSNHEHGCDHSVKPTLCIDLPETMKERSSWKLLM